MEEGESTRRRRWRLRSILDTINCLNVEDDDDDEFLHQRRKSIAIDKQIKLDKKQYEATYRILLLGAGESGKSTIVKQMKILHQNGYNDEERLKLVEDIRHNVLDAIVTISEALFKLDPPVELENPENQKHIDWLLENKPQIELEKTYSQEFFDRVSVLWKDKGILQTYERSHEYQLIDCAKYFLDRVSRVRQPNYLPTNQDILWCRVLTDRIVETRFRIHKVNFHLFDVGGQTHERKKWIQCFYDVTAILFVCSCSSYNMVLREDNTKNRLEESFTLFEQVWKNRWLCTRSIILFLNKYDMLAEKIKMGKSKFEDYFPDVLNISQDVEKDFSLIKFNEPYEVLRAMHYIQNKFIKLSLPTRKVKLKNGETKVHLLYPHFTCAVNTENIRTVFEDCRDIIQRLHMQDMGIL